MENFRTATQRFGERGRADRQDHELLDIEAVVGVRTTVDDVHHRHGQRQHLLLARQVAPQAHAAVRRGRVRRRQRDRQQGIRAETRLGLRAIRGDHRGVQPGLVCHVAAHRQRGEFAVHISHGLLHALAKVAAGIAVAQFHGFTAAGAGTRGHGRTAEHAVFQHNIGFDGGVATGVDDFAANNAGNLRHVRSSS